MSSELTDRDGSFTDGIDPESKDLIRDLVASHNRLENRIDELEQQLAARDVRIEDLEQQQRRLSNLVDGLFNQSRKVRTLLAGSHEEFASWDVDEMTPIHARLLNAESELEEHEDKLRMMVVDDGQKGTPDERPMHLRQVLYNEGKQVYLLRERLIGCTVLTIQDAGMNSPLMSYPICTANTI